MSDKYNQIKETWKIKSILNEAANDWKQSYGCYPTVKEFINLINEYSVAPLNTSNILVEDRLITSNDITWLSKTIINEQSAGMEKIAGFSDKQWEDFLSTIEGTEDPKHPMRQKRAEALKQYPNAMEQRSRAEDPKGWKAKDAAAKKAATAAETTAKYWQAREQEKANTARGQTERVGTPPSAAPPAQERVRVTPQEAAKAPDWKAPDWSSGSVRETAQERINKEQASRKEEYRKRWAEQNRSSGSSPPSPAKTSVADRLYTAADNTGNKIFTGLQKAGTATKTVGRGTGYVLRKLGPMIPSIVGQGIGGEFGRYVTDGSTAGFVAGEVLGAMGIGNGINIAIEKAADKKWLPARVFGGYKAKDHNLGLFGAAGFVGGGYLGGWLNSLSDDAEWKKNNPYLGAVVNTATPLVTYAAGSMAGNAIDKKVVPKVAAAAKTVGTKLAPKTAKLAGKAMKWVPGLGWVAAAAAIGLGARKAFGGDPVGGGLEMLSGGAALVPGVGTAASVGLDAVGAYRDMSPEDREVVNQGAKDAVNIPKQVKNVAQGIVPSGLSIPPESEDEKQRKRMLDPDNETVTAPPTGPENPLGNGPDIRKINREITQQRRLQPVNEQFQGIIKGGIELGSKVLEKELVKGIWKAIEKRIGSEVVKEVPKVLEKEAVRVPFEIPTYTNHPITVAKPLNPISLPTAAPPTITTTNTSVPTGIQTSTTTFPIPKVNVPTTPTTAVPSLPATKTDIPTTPAKAVPTLPRTNTDIPTTPAKAVPTLPATKTDTSTAPAVKTETGTITDTGTNTDTNTDTNTKTRQWLLRFWRTRTNTKTDPYRPPATRTGITTTDKTKDDDSGNNTTALTSVLSDPSLSDFDANTERLHARKGTYLPQYNQNSGKYINTAQTIQINEDGATGDQRKKQVRRDSDTSEESGTEDAAPRLRGTELGARKGVSMPYWDQGTQSYKYMAQTVGLQESRSGTLNTKSALQARAKKQRYKVTVVENGKKLEVFATSIRGIRRVVYGKKNFRVHDGKGADITNYFKRLMSSNKSA